jgi:methionine aminopeptidase
VTSKLQPEVVVKLSLVLKVSGVDGDVGVAAVLNMNVAQKAKVALKKVAADVIPALKKIAKKIAGDAPQLLKPPIRSRAITAEAAEAARKVAANVALVPKLVLEVTRADPVV